MSKQHLNLYYAKKNIHVPLIAYKTVLAYGYALKHKENQVEGKFCGTLIHLFCLRTKRRKDKTTYCVSTVLSANV